MDSDLLHFTWRLCIHLKMQWNSKYNSNCLWCDFEPYMFYTENGRKKHYSYDFLFMYLTIHLLFRWLVVCQIQSIKTGRIYPIKLCRQTQIYRGRTVSIYISNLKWLRIVNYELVEKGNWHLKGNNAKN